MKKKMKEKKVVGKNQPKSAAKVADKGTVKKSKKEVSVDTEKVSKDAKIMESKSAIRKARKEDKKKETQLGDPVEVKNLISTLSQAAMLVKLEVSAWRGTGSDKEVAAVLAGQFNGSVDGFSVGLKFLKPEIRKELNSRLHTLNKWVTNNSLPFGEGWRLLASALYSPLKVKVEECRIEIRDFIYQITQPGPYAEIRRYAKEVLGSAFKEERIPSPEEIRAKFNVHLAKDVIHIPTKLEKVDAEEMESLQEEMRESLARKYQNGVMDLVEGLRETLEVLVEELEGCSDRDKYATILKMCESRIEEIIRLDVFKSKRVRHALEKINDDVLNPLRESLYVLKKDEKKKKSLAVSTKKTVKDVLDNIRV